MHSQLYATPRPTGAIKLIEEYKKIASIIIPYTLMCAYLHLHFYWSEFQIQPFEYISVSEAISYSATFLTFSAFMIVPIMILEYIRPSKYSNNPGSEDNPSYIKPLISIPLIINVTIIFLANSSIKISPLIFIGLIGGMLPGAVSLSHTKPLTDNFSAASSRLFVCLVICCLPAVSITQAIIAKNESLNEETLKYILGSDLSEGLESPKTKLVFIGTLADHIFLIREGEKTIVQYQRSNLKRLELRDNDHE